MAGNEIFQAFLRMACNSPATVLMRKEMVIRNDWRVLLPFRRCSGRFQEKIAIGEKILCPQPLFKANCIPGKYCVSSHIFLAQRAGRGVWFIERRFDAVSPERLFLLLFDSRLFRWPHVYAVVAYGFFMTVR